MASPGWSTAVAPFRDFLDGAERLVAQPTGDLALRQELTSTHPFVALTFLMTKAPSYRAAYLPEILGAIARGPHQSLLLARDVFRCLPRATLEETVPVAMAGILDSDDDDVYSRIAEVVIELRLDAALAALRLAAERHPNEEIRELHDELEDVENDLSRWGRLVQEWPIRETG